MDVLDTGSIVQLNRISISCDVDREDKVQTNRGCVSKTRRDINLPQVA